MSLTTPLRAAAFFATTAFAAQALADDADKKACTEAYEAAQVHKQSLEYRAARKDLDRCVNRACPAFIQADCAAWLNDVTEATPSVVIAARDGANDVSDVKVSLDGVQVLAALDGRELEVDPGKHTLRFEHGQYSPIEESLIFRAGEKRRAIAVQFGSVPPPPAPTPTPSPPVPVDTVPRHRPIPAVVYAFSAVGVLGLASFTYFAIDGRAKLSDLKKTCSPFCTDDDVQPTKRSLLVADVSLGVGVVALAAAAYFFATRPSVPVRDVTVGTRGVKLTPDMRIAHDAGYVGIRGAF